MQLQLNSKSSNSHIHTVLSLPHVAKYLESSLHPTPLTSDSWPSNFYINLYFSPSKIQTQTKESNPPVANRLPFFEKLTDLIVLECASSKHY